VQRHMRQVPCPDPTDEAALHAIAVEAVGTRLPLDRPPWVAVIVTGLAGQQGALIVVFHHVLADGIGGLAVLAQLADGAPPTPDEGFPDGRPPRGAYSTTPAPGGRRRWRTCRGGCASFATPSANSARPRHPTHPGPRSTNPPGRGVRCG
jgi:diacylglycerol O-acyltransferase / wax synthase